MKNKLSDKQFKYYIDLLTRFNLPFDESVDALPLLNKLAILNRKKISHKAKLKRAANALALVREIKRKKDIYKLKKTAIKTVDEKLDDITLAAALKHLG